MAVYLEAVYILKSSHILKSSQSFFVRLFIKNVS